MEEVLKAYLNYVKNEIGCFFPSCEVIEGRSKTCEWKDCSIIGREVKLYKLNLSTFGNFYYIDDSVDGKRVGVVVGKSFYAVAKDADYNGNIEDLLNNPIKEVVKSPKSNFSDAFFRLLECYFDEDELYENLANEFVRSCIKDGLISFDEFYKKISSLFSFNRLFFKLMHYVFESEIEFSNKKEFEKYLISIFGNKNVYK